MRSWSHHRRNRGFSLIDLMAALTLVAVVVTIAAPAVQSYLEASRLRAAGWSFVSDLHRARRRAIVENRSQRLTVSTDPSGTSASYVVAPAGTGSPAETRGFPDGVKFENDAGTYVEFDSRGLSPSTAEFRLQGTRPGTVTIRVRSTGHVDLSTTG